MKLTGFDWFALGLILLMLLSLAYLLADDTLWPVPHYEAVPGGPVGTP